MTSPDTPRSHRSAHESSLSVLVLLIADRCHEAALAGQIGRVTGKKAVLTVERDASLIGGFTVQYEDTVWDASVRRQLELMRARLVGGA